RQGARHRGAARAAVHRRRGDRMRRREFIVLRGGTAAAWPQAARAQQTERMRRIGVLMSDAANDPEGQARVTVFVQALQQLGWTDGRNMRIDVRWGAVDADRYRKYAEELVALAPDVILATSSAALGTLQRATRTVPIVFAVVADPVGAGYVDSLARPGGNASGFALFEYGIAGKWLELLKQIAPALTRAAVMRDQTISLGIGQWAVIQAMAPSTGVDLSLVNMRDASEIERDITAFARSSNGGLIVTASPLASQHRELIIRLAAVLAFQNMSGDAEQEYFADGIVEDIITALSRFQQLFVIARNSSFTYKGRAVDVKQVS